MRSPRDQILDELGRRIAGLLRVGVVHEIDYPGLRLRVRSGDIVTGWLPWPGYLGRNRVDWTPLLVGQEVLIAAPGGDLSQAVVVALLHVAGDPPPSTDPTKDVVRFRSGTTVEHDAETGDLTITAQRHVNITVKGDVSLTATGDVDITAAHINLN